MKNSFNPVLTLIYLCFFIGFFYLGLPSWLLLLLLPAVAYLQIYVAQQYNFRDSLEVEEIPARGFGSRLLVLTVDEKRISDLGFFKFDEFYLRISNDAVFFVYQHRELPITLCQYHTGNFISVDLMTDFEGDFSLTTNNFKYSSVMALRPANEMFQSFEDFPIEMLFDRHVDSLRFLESKGFSAKEEPLENFRAAVIRDFRKTAKRSKSLLHPAKIFYLMFFGNKARFSKSIQEQFLANQLQLPSSRK